MSKAMEELEKKFIKCQGEVRGELAKGTKKIDAMQESVDNMSHKISLLIEIFEAGEKFFKVIGWAGKGIKWVAMVGGSITVIWYFFKTGSWHK